MITGLIQNCGIFFLPQLAISVATVSLVIGYLVALMRHEVPRGQKPWAQTLDPLGSVAVSIGLLGSVVGFISAFGGFQNGIDVKLLTSGLAVAYYTTGVGIFTSLLGSLGSYVLGIIAK